MIPQLIQVQSLLSVVENVSAFPWETRLEQVTLYAVPRPLLAGLEMIQQ